MSVALVTGSAGLIGSEAVRHFAALGLDVVGIDNDMRGQFFGPEASTAWNVTRLTDELGAAYIHHHVDIRDRDALGKIFGRYGGAIAVSSTPPPSQATTGRRATPTPTSTSTRSGPSTCSRTRVSTASKRRSSTARPT